jgi:hypothetical protein
MTATEMLGRLAVCAVYSERCATGGLRGAVIPPVPAALLVPGKAT